MQQLKEADITYKARGDEFHSVKLVYLEEKDSCLMKVQEVVFGEFKTVEFPKEEFESLVRKLERCNIPFPGYSNGKSGTQYQLDIQAGENSMNFKWFGDSPGSQWKDITGFARDILILKDSFMK